MIDAVKSTLAVTSGALKTTEQPSSSRAASTSAKVEDSKVSLDDGHYTTRNVRVDAQSKVAVLEFRNPLNGDVKTQIPTKAQLEAYESPALRIDNAPETSQSV